MEQRIGISRLTQVPGPDGEATFDAADDDAALAYAADHLMQRIKNCVRAELSSMSIVADAASANGRRCIDDSLVNPHFQDIYLKFNIRTQHIDVDFESTRSTVVPDFAAHRFPRAS